VNGPWDRPLERTTRLLAGLAMYGLGLALLVKADLGLDPWTVFAQGVSRHTGLSLGEVTVLSSVLVLILWIPLRQRPGVGTIANALLVGPVLDLGVGIIPTPHEIALRVVFLLAALGGIAIATGLYVGAGWGPGPRDGLMTGLAAHGVPVAVGRTGIELTVLIVGWSLGGTVGIGTALYAASIGPMVSGTLPRLRVPATRSG
jgi:uncharacterized membrane protein YczE